MPDGNGRGLGTVSYIALPSTPSSRDKLPLPALLWRLFSCARCARDALEMHATTNRFRAMLRKTSGFQDEQC
jgi:hypothetical protein